MYEVIKEHAKFAKGEGTGVGKELLSLPNTPEYNYAANTYLTALAYIRELEERLTKRAVDVAKPATKQHNPMYEWSPNMDAE